MANREAPKPGEIRLISLDLDGTLLRSDNRIGERTRTALKKAHDRGVSIVLNSGRMTPSMEFAAELLDFDVHLISYNGAAASSPKAQGRAKLFEKPMFLDVARELLAFAKTRGLQLNYYLDEVIYSEDAPHLRPHIDLYVRRTGSPYKFVERAEAHATRAPYKVLFIVDPKVRDPLEAELAPRYASRATITRTDPEYLEFLHPEVDKGVGLRGLAAAMGFSMEQVMAVGDADNDEPMVRAAGWGVGMANAKPSVRAVARAITQNDHNHDGVGEAVERWVLG
ncbi:MAG: HAD family phosphatase [Planctomycetota bacterium]|nr:HAD family phosphatase [Planctomycetota bacterium]